MTDMLDNLVDYINTFNTFGAATATNMFETYMPDTPNNCWMILDTGGQAPDAYLPIKLPTIQILTRNSNELAGRTNAIAMRDFLHQKANFQAGTSYFYYILALQEPYSIGKDGSGRYEFSENFVCLAR